MSEQPKIFNKAPKLPTQSEAGGSVDSGIQSLMRSLRFAFLALVVIIVGTMVYFITLGGYIAVPPQEAVIVLRFGAYNGTYYRGPHWFFPYPVNEFISIPTSPQTLKVEYLPEQRREDQPPLKFLDSGIDGFLLTSDTNIVHTSWSFTYIITEPEVYYKRCLTPSDPRNPDDMYPYGKTPPTGRGPQTLLKSLLNEAVIIVTSQMSIDDILTKRSEYRERVFAIFSQSVISMNLGIIIDNLEDPQVNPPLQTQNAFLEATGAGATRDTYITEANAFAIRTASNAESYANSVMADAESYKLQIVSQLRSESIYFNSILTEYQKNSSSTLVTLYNDVLGQALSGVREKYFIGSSANGEQKEIRLKLNPEINRQAPANGSNDQAMAHPGNR